FRTSPDVVWNLLRKLRAAAYHYHEGAALREAAEAAGITPKDFKADTSDTAAGMYPGRYRKTYVNRSGEREQIVLGPHLKGGGTGNRNDTVCIYWYLDNDPVHGNRFVVGHVGAKLKDSTGGY
ncbi:unnamed protein product, partial [Phaeothamnion confervicola]